MNFTPPEFYDTQKENIEDNNIIFESTTWIESTKSHYIL